MWRGKAMNRRGANRCSGRLSSFLSFPKKIQFNCLFQIIIFPRWFHWYIQYFHNTYNTRVQAAGGADPWPRPQRSGGIKSRSPETGLEETKRRLRTILRQDLVTTSSSPWIRKDRCLFLFNDILLITTVSRRGAKVLAKSYFVEKFLGMNKHVHRRSREACRLCRAVCRRC